MQVDYDAKNASNPPYSLSMESARALQLQRFYHLWVMIWAIVDTLRFVLQPHLSRFFLT